MNIFRVYLGVFKVCQDRLNRDMINMKAFGQIDFVGDACIRILAKHYQPNNPDSWNSRFGKNIFLAELYRSVMGDIRPPKLKYTSKKEKTTHLRASHVEAWLGTAFEQSGIEEVIMLWERLIGLWRVWKAQDLRNKLIVQLVDVENTAAMASITV